MKKVLCCLLAVLFLFSSGYAETVEDFTYHDIKFGSTQEEVLAVEGDRFYSKGKDQIVNGWFVTLSSIENSRMSYNFKSGSLDSISLFYNVNNKDEEILISEYNKIENGLNEKYGEGRSDIDTVNEYKGSISEELLSKYEFLFFKQRMVQYTGYSVLIEHFLMRYKDKRDRYVYRHDLYYKYRPDGWEEVVELDDDL